MDVTNSPTSSPYVNTGLPPQNTPTVPATTPVNTTPYKTDAFAPTSSYAMNASIIQSCPVSQIIEDQAFANKLNTFFMGSSDKFLRVGSTWIGRTIINLLDGNIPLITSSAVSTQKSNSINSWLGRADLVRAGVTPYQAVLFQDIGLKNINDLSAITNPNDQMAVAQMLTAASNGRGQPIFVTQANVSAWVATAQTLPKYL